MLEKVKGIYNGYRLENGKVYQLVEHSNNNYEMVEVIDVNNLYDVNNYIHTGIFFNRVKAYKEYLKTL